MKPYTVAKSIAGRDSGEWFAVISEADGLCLIVNGKSRPLAHPKRKKAKHLQFTSTVLCSESLTTDRKLRAALKAISADSNEGGNDLGQG